MLWKRVTRVWLNENGKEVVLGRNLDGASDAVLSLFGQSRLEEAER